MLKGRTEIQEYRSYDHKGSWTNKSTKTGTAGKMLPRHRQSRIIIYREDELLRGYEPVFLSISESLALRENVHEEFVTSDMPKGKDSLTFAFLVTFHDTQIGNVREIMAIDEEIDQEFDYMNIRKRAIKVVSRMESYKTIQHKLKEKTFLVVVLYTDIPDE